MTHTNHRQGSIEDLKGDWVVLMRVSQGINSNGHAPKLKKFLELAQKYDPVNGGGCSKIGNALTSGWDKLIDCVSKTAEKGANIPVVFDSVEKVAGFIKDLVKADIGLSVVISGLHEETDRICREAGTKRHTINYSLGVWGKTELLPEPKLLEMTTMCGHGLVSVNLIRRMAKSVKNGSLSLKQAAIEIAKPCTCGIVNPKRAQALIQEYNALSEDE